MKKVLSIMLLCCLLLTLAVPALAADQGTQAGQAQEIQAQNQGAPAGFFDRLQSKLSDLATAIAPVMLVVAAIVLMFSARHGKQFLVWIVARAFLALGGWRLLVDLIRYVLS
ncbi:MAG: hypothetical protein H5T99_01290 [Moorella sp. (in: Bacteria)]|nr:hypothetical protein [Moorella sp. (in: firmicutes)]